MSSPNAGQAANLTYVGTELELFAHATNWKRYWASQVRRYLGARVVEVGAGMGANTPLLYTNQARWIALEPDPRLARQLCEARARGALPSVVDVIAGPLGSLGAEERFDAVVYIDVLEHIRDDRAELSDAGAHLYVGGRLVVLAPAHQFLYSPFDEAVGHFRRYDRKTLHGLKPLGMVLETMRYLDSAGLAISLANRLVLRSSKPSLPQIRFWDRCIVPISRSLDPLTGWRVGKSILAVWRKVGTA